MSVARRGSHARLRWRPVAIDHRAAIREAVGDYVHWSDFNLVSLISWDVDSANRFAIVDGCLAIRISNYAGGEELVALAGVGDVAQVASTLVDDVRADGHSGTLSLVPAPIAVILEGTGRFTAALEPDDTDYVLDVERLASLQGGALATRRSAVNRLLRDWPEARATAIDLRFERGQNALRRLVVQWATANPESASRAEDELVAIQRAIAHAGPLGIEAIGVEQDGRLLAAILFEVTTDGWSVLHFDKCDHRTIGVAPFLKRELARHLLTRGVRWLNYEQDLGLEGLRTAKQRYAPALLLEKATVTPRFTGPG